MKFLTIFNKGPRVFLVAWRPASLTASPGYIYSRDLVVCYVAPGHTAGSISGGRKKQVFLNIRKRFLVLIFF